MGQKTHPTGFRLGTTVDWKSHWFARNPRTYVARVLEDRKIREFIRSHVGPAGVQKIEIERALNNLKITVHVARPGMVIGRGGANIESLRDGLERICGTRPELSVEEVRDPNLSAELIAQEIVHQIERRRHPKRVMSVEAEKVMSRGAKGVKIEVRGRVGGGEFARVERITRGSVPLQTIRALVDYAQKEARTKYGTLGVKVWIYLGEAEI